MSHGWLQRLKISPSTGHIRDDALDLLGCRWKPEGSTSSKVVNDVVLLGLGKEGVLKRQNLKNI